MVLKLMLKERTERRAFLREYCIARCLSGHAACIHALPLAFENSTHFAFGQELAPAGDLCNLLTPGVCVSQGWGAQQWAGEEKGLGKGCSGYREEVGTKRTLQRCEITGRMCVHGEALCNREHVCVMHGDIICRNCVPMVSMGRPSARGRMLMHCTGTSFAAECMPMVFLRRSFAVGCTATYFSVWCMPTLCMGTRGVLHVHPLQWSVSSCGAPGAPSWYPLGSAMGCVPCWWYQAGIWALQQPLQGK